VQGHVVVITQDAVADAWEGDAALELWVDDRDGVVVVQLAGTLGPSTEAFVEAILEQELAVGHRHFVLAARPGAVVEQEPMDRLQRLVARAGGRLEHSAPEMLV
jgi:hypothetical protein